MTSVLTSSYQHWLTMSSKKAIRVNCSQHFITESSCPRTIFNICIYSRCCKKKKQKKLCIEAWQFWFIDRAIRMPCFSYKQFASGGWQECLEGNGKDTNISTYSSMKVVTRMWSTVNWAMNKQPYEQILVPVL